MCSVARGKTCAGRMLTAASSAWNAASYASAISARRLVLEAGLDEHPVLAAIEVVVAQVPDVGDVLDVEHVEAVVQQDAPDEVGQQVRCAGCRRGRSGRRSGRRCTSGRGPARAARRARPTRRQRVAEAQGHGAIVEALGAGRPTARKGFRRTARILRADASPDPPVCSSPWSSAPAVDRPPRRRERQRAHPLAAPTTSTRPRSGDAASAAVIAQLFETLTAFDETLQLRPALAESWRIDEAAGASSSRCARTCAFSDGTPLRASDVVRSWLRLIDPAAPSPLVRSCSTSSAPPSTSTGLAARRTSGSPRTTTPGRSPSTSPGRRPTSRRSWPARRSGSSRRASTTPTRSAPATASSRAAATA